MLKRWRNAQRRPARRPGVYSDRISLDASNSPTNSNFFCQRIGFFLAFSMAEFRARSRLFHESGVLVLVLGLLFRWQFAAMSLMLWLIGYVGIWLFMLFKPVKQN